MGNVLLAMSIAEQHQRDLRTESAARRLGAIAQCCRPTRMAAFLRATANRLVNLQRNTGPETACCA